MRPNEISYDPADLPTAAAVDDPIDHILEALCPKCGKVVDAACPCCGGNVESSGSTDSRMRAYESDTYRRLLLILDKWPDARFTLQCYFVATGAGFAGGLSMSTIAQRFGRTKASVSKRCREICRALGIPRSSYMRDEDAAEHSRQRNFRPSKL